MNKTSKKHKKLLKAHSPPTLKATQPIVLTPLKEPQYGPKVTKNELKKEVT
jgi:hypothetical protein